MARVTVEDCIDKIPNRYELLMVAAQRAKDLSAGAPLTVAKDNDKNPVIALREIAEETGYDDLELVRETFKINHHYYAYNKDKYFNIESTGLLFKLKSNHKLEQQLDEDEKFTVEWVGKDDIEKEVKDELHLKTFTYCLEEGAMEGDGTHINSDILNGLNKEEAINKIITWLEENNLGKKKVNYRLQDWIFSRQRFWGEPIPLIYCEDCGWVPVPEEELPVLLPDVAEYEPTDDGESPLANIESWVNAPCPRCGKMGRRETDTMPNWAGSSWYFLRYMDAHNDKEFVSQEALKYWGKVNWYNGGMEHTTRHLLYARFWNQFLYNIGLVPNKEPVEIRVSHGMILGSNGEKMSKSKGNVINPDDIISEMGADALRTYEMFIGDYEKDASWSTNGLKGCKKFLDRIWRLQEKLNDKDGYSNETLVHQTIKKVGNDIANMKYNTAVSSLMIMLNELEKYDSITRGDLRILVHLLNPIAPHITEEINEINQLGEPLYASAWPIYDEAKTIESTYEMVVQVNGKVRGKIEVDANTSEEDMKTYAMQIENVKVFTDGKEIVKVIVVPKKLVNIVVK